VIERNRVMANSKIPEYLMNRFLRIGFQ